MKIIVDDSDILGLVKIIKLYQNGFSSLWRYTITHFIRRIHDKQYFKSTELVNKTTKLLPNLSQTASVLDAEKMFYL
jgi:hypothetical protein